MTHFNIRLSFLNSLASTYKITSNYNHLEYVISTLKWLEPKHIDVYNMNICHPEIFFLFQWLLDFHTINL